MVEREAVDASLAAVLREERARLTAALVRILGDWDAAEELVQRRIRALAVKFHALQPTCKVE